MSGGMMILIIFSLLIFVLLIVIGVAVCIVKHNRNKKKKMYKGIAEGRIDKIKWREMDSPDVITVTYFVDGAEYQIKETLKLKSEPIKIGGIPIGQRKSYRIGSISVGDYVTVQYDLQNPK